MDVLSARCDPHRLPSDKSSASGLPTSLMEGDPSPDPDPGAPMPDAPAQPASLSPAPAASPASSPAVAQPQARSPFTSKIWQRPSRVIALVVVVVLFSIADLYMTLTHVTSIGMLEGNPLARWIMRNLDPSAVILWKSLTLLIASAILIKLRHKPCGEVAAWICAAILVWLMFRWVGYAENLSMLTPEEMQLVMETDESQWVMPPS
jgi:Domain of unknown function (DUF5658)